MRSEKHQIEYLKDGRRIQRPNPEERERGTGDEDAELVEGGICRIEGSVVFEG